MNRASLLVTLHSTHLLALSALVLAACGSCGTSSLPGAPPLTASIDAGLICPATSLPPSPSCGLDGGIAHNELPHNELPHNSLTAASLDTNQPLLDHLRTHALSPSLFASNPELLSEKYASDLMKYIASCALDPCDAVTIPPRANPTKPDALDEVRARFPDGFTGELGLCGKRYNTWASQAVPPPNNSGSTAATAGPTWASSVPSLACLERVSACVLARVNKVEKRVAISMRGAGLTTFPRVPVETTFRENHGIPIVSFQGCDKRCLWGDPLRRNCDWEPRFVGQCVAGPKAPPANGNTQPPPRQVTLSVGAGARLRVCRGIHGCDDPNAPFGAGEATNAPPRTYGGDLIGQSAGSIVFDCPDNGPIVRDPAGTKYRTGYYSVMIGSMTSGVRLPDGHDATLAASADNLPAEVSAHDAYHATEENVFTYREGGFYGTLFSMPTPAMLAAQLKKQKKVKKTPPCDGVAMLAGYQYACFSKMWSDGVAMANDRFCAGPKHGCFMNDPKSCDIASNDTDNTILGTAPTPPTLDREVYDSVRTPGAPRVWHHPYTIYLNHPCDLLPSLAECKGYLTPSEDGPPIGETDQ